MSGPGFWPSGGRTAPPFVSPLAVTDVVGRPPGAPFVLALKKKKIIKILKLNEKKSV